MKVYNTLSRQKEAFVPVEPGQVKMYACGPTVYNLIHIGNARPICVFDTLRRYLEYRGYRVTFVQNFTDIDDKLIHKANEEGITVQAVAARYIEEYWVDAKGLGVRPADIHPKATETMEGILTLVKTLVDEGYAYEREGSVYFRSRKFKGYGKLSHQSLEDLTAGARVDVSEHKEDPLDFVVWKAAKPGEPSWDSPWGKGRPGWHIECTAMIKEHLGDHIDIHCGGQDLIFPHHENEIAQAESCCSGQYAKYWMHNGYINVDNQKMSKSLGNFFTTREVANRFGYEPIRFMMLQAHYRSPINYSFDVIKQCRAALDRLYTCRDHIDFALNTSSTTPDVEAEDAFAVLLGQRRAEFLEAMDDDLNTADAIAALFALVRDINTFATTPRSVGILTQAAALFDELCDVLGILYNRPSKDLDSDIEALIAERQEARKVRDFAKADAIRAQLLEQGIVLEDTPQGIKWSRKE